MHILHTERLTLRWCRDDDAAFILALLNDPAWIEHIGDRHVRTLDEAHHWIATRLSEGYWQKGLGLWLMERTSDRAPLGLCGLIQRESLPTVDVGYALAVEHRGQGYVREAARACLDYGARVLDLRKILAITSPENEPSKRVLDALGMRLEARTVLEGETRPTLVYAYGEGTETRTDLEQVNALAARFFAAFTNRDGAVPTLPALPYLCVPGARIVFAGANPSVAMDLPTFMRPRAAMLSDGSLTDFFEREVEAETRFFGRMAQRWVRYEKSGVLRGEPYQGTGHKSMQCVKTARGWRIAAVTWDDAL